MSDYVWLSDLSQRFLEKDYLAFGQTVDHRVRIISSNAERILGKSGYAKKFVENMKKGWYSLSTPVWTNYGTDRGLPISCFGSYIEDSMESILSTAAEIGMMSKYGGGTSAYFGAIRARGSEIRGNGESSGAVHFQRLLDTLINLVSQGSARRGQAATYLNVYHPDINEHLDIRSEGNPIQDLSFGVCIPDWWMEGMISGDPEKRTIWAKIIQRRYESGYPYIFFTDNSNSGTAQVYKDGGMKIYASNLCNEIHLPSSPDESFVCCLSSMNILHYDEWKNTDAVGIMIEFLDTVITEFVDKARNVPFMHRPVRFAERHRALGLGWLGWHSYLQSKGIPFESMEAKMLNVQIAKTIRDQSYNASRRLAVEYGEPEVMKGRGMRNSTTSAIAPTKSSAFILGQVSESIQPDNSNYYTADLAKGRFSIRNPYLKKLLGTKDKDTEGVWSTILRDGGSVQGLDFLSAYEKDVFKTFSEISPMEVVIQAAQRQKYIDQGQSLNLMIHPKTPARDVSALMIEAWRLGIKGLYYQISINSAQEFSRSILSCSSCEA